MSKQRIAIDCDDVLIDFVRHFVHHHNTVYGTTLAYNDITSFLLHDIFGVPSEEFEERIWGFIASPQHLEITRVPGALDALHRLSKKYELHIVTSRIETLTEETEALLRLVFPPLFECIHYTNGAGFHHNLPRRTKGEVCEELDISILIEDGIPHAVDAVEFGIAVLLVDRPWNQHETPEGTKRVYSWEEIEEWVTTHFE